MTTLDKIKTWARENGYELHWYQPTLLENHRARLVKRITDRFERETKALMVINCRVFDTATPTIDSSLSIPIPLEQDSADFLDIRSKEQYKSYCIPLNNVKRDEKLLKEYLEND